MTTDTATPGTPTSSTPTSSTRTPGTTEQITKAGTAEADTGVHSHLVRIGQLSTMLGVPQWTLRRYADAGHIPVVRARGQQRRFDPQLVREALSRLGRAGGNTDSLATADAGPLQRPHDRVTGEVTPASTEPVTPPTWEREYQIDGLEEDLVWRDAVAATRIDADTPASKLLEYSLEEMVNNAIDHSGGTTVTVRLWSTPDMLAFQVADNGEGAFTHLRKGLGLEDDFEAIATLTKGKQTTWRERHSGEGIFFTSKMNDIFKITANGKAWTVDNVRDDQSVGIAGDTTGTRVYGQVDPNTTRTSSEVFARFIDDDYAFTRTRPSVKLASLGLRFASRSEARRLMAGLGEFTEIDIDFAGVSEVGQGFIDEVFRVWANNHPDKALNPINMNAAVEFMVRRGLGRT